MGIEIISEYCELAATRVAKHLASLKTETPRTFYARSMQNLTYPELFEYIGANIIKPFYELRLKRLEELQLHVVLKRKNPYLFKAKNITTAQDLVTEILQAHLSSQEETLFGKYLEELAVFISARVYGGFKSSAPGIDLELEKEANDTLSRSNRVLTGQIVSKSRI